MSEEQMYIPEYVKDGIIFGIILLAIIYIWSEHSPMYHYSALYQHMSVLSTVSFCFAIFFIFIDLIFGFPIAKYEAATDRLAVFMMNAGLIYVVYLIGAKYFGFNDMVQFY